MVSNGKENGFKWFQSGKEMIYARNHEIMLLLWGQKYPLNRHLWGLIWGLISSSISFSIIREHAIVICVFYWCFDALKWDCIAVFCVSNSAQIFLRMKISQRFSWKNAYNRLCRLIVIVYMWNQYRLEVFYSNLRWYSSGGQSNRDGTRFPYLASMSKSEIQIEQMPQGA